METQPFPSVTLKPEPIDGWGRKKDYSLATNAQLSDYRRSSPRFFDLTQPQGEEQPKTSPIPSPTQQSTPSINIGVQSDTDALPNIPSDDGDVSHCSIRSLASFPLDASHSRETKRASLDKKRRALLRYYWDLDDFAQATERGSVIANTGNPYLMPSASRGNDRSRSRVSPQMTPPWQSTRGSSLPQSRANTTPTKARSMTSSPVTATLRQSPTNGPIFPLPQAVTTSYSFHIAPIPSSVNANTMTFNTTVSTTDATCPPINTHASRLEPLTSPAKPTKVVTPSQESTTSTTTTTPISATPTATTSPPVTDLAFTTTGAETGPRNVGISLGFVVPTDTGLGQTKRNVTNTNIQPVTLSTQFNVNITTLPSASSTQSIPSSASTGGRSSLQTSHDPYLTSSSYPSSALTESSSAKELQYSSATTSSLREGSSGDSGSSMLGKSVMSLPTPLTPSNDAEPLPRPPPSADSSSSAIGNSSVAHTAPPILPPQVRPRPIPSTSQSGIRGRAVSINGPTPRTTPAPDTPTPVPASISISMTISSGGSQISDARTTGSLTSPPLETVPSSDQSPVGSNDTQTSVSSAHTEPPLLTRLSSNQQQSSQHPSHPPHPPQTSHPTSQLSHGITASTAAIGPLPQTTETTPSEPSEKNSLRAAEVAGLASQTKPPEETTNSTPSVSNEHSESHVFTFPPEPEQPGAHKPNVQQPQTVSALRLPSFVSASGNDLIIPDPTTSPIVVGTPVSLDPQRSDTTASTAVKDRLRSSQSTSSTQNNDGSFANGPASTSSLIVHPPSDHCEEEGEKKTPSVLASKSDHQPGSDLSPCPFFCRSCRHVCSCTCSTCSLLRSVSAPSSLGSIASEPPPHDNDSTSSLSKAPFPNHPETRKSQTPNGLSPPSRTLTKVLSEPTLLQTDHYQAKPSEPSSSTSSSDTSSRREDSAMDTSPTSDASSISDPRMAERRMTYLGRARSLPEPVTNASGADDHDTSNKLRMMPSPSDKLTFEPVCSHRPYHFPPRHLICTGSLTPSGPMGGCQMNVPALPPLPVATTPTYKLLSDSIATGITSGQPFPPTAARPPPPPPPPLPHAPSNGSVAIGVRVDLKIAPTTTLGNTLPTNPPLTTSVSSSSDIPSTSCQPAHGPNVQAQLVMTTTSQDGVTTSAITHPLIAVNQGMKSTRPRVPKVYPFPSPQRSKLGQQFTLPPMLLSSQQQQQQLNQNTSASSNGFGAPTATALPYKPGTVADGSPADGPLTLSDGSASQPPSSQSASGSSVSGQGNTHSGRDDCVSPGEIKPPPKVTSTFPRTPSDETTASTVGSTGPSTASSTGTGSTTALATPPHTRQTSPQATPESKLESRKNVVTPRDSIHLPPLRSPSFNLPHAGTYATTPRGTGSDLRNSFPSPTTYASSSQRLSRTPKSLGLSPPQLTPPLSSCVNPSSTLGSSALSSTSSRLRASSSLAPPQSPLLPPRAPISPMSTTRYLYSSSAFRRDLDDPSLGNNRNSVTARSHGGLPSMACQGITATCFHKTYQSPVGDSTGKNDLTSPNEHSKYSTDPDSSFMPTSHGKMKNLYRDYDLKTDGDESDYDSDTDSGSSKDSLSLEGGNEARKSKATKGTRTDIRRSLDSTPVIGSRDSPKLDRKATPITPVASADGSAVKQNNTPLPSPDLSSISTSSGQSTPRGFITLNLPSFSIATMPLPLLRSSVATPGVSSTPLSSTTGPSNVSGNAPPTTVTQASSLLSPHHTHSHVPLTVTLKPYESDATISSLRDHNRHINSQKSTSRLPSEDLVTLSPRDTLYGLDKTQEQATYPVGRGSEGPISSVETPSQQLIMPPSSSVDLEPIRDFSTPSISQPPKLKSLTPHPLSSQSQASRFRPTMVRPPTLVMDNEGDGGEGGASTLTTDAQRFNSYSCPAALSSSFPRSYGKRVTYSFDQPRPVPGTGRNNIADGDNSSEDHKLHRDKPHICKLSEIKEGEETKHGVHRHHTSAVHLPSHRHHLCYPFNYLDHGHHRTRSHAKAPPGLPKHSSQRARHLKAKRTKYMEGSEQKAEGSGSRVEGTPEGLGYGMVYGPGSVQSDSSPLQIAEVQSEPSLPPGEIYVLDRGGSGRWRRRPSYILDNVVFASLGSPHRAASPRTSISERGLMTTSRLTPSRIPLPRTAKRYQIDTAGLVSRRWRGSIHRASRSTSHRPPVQTIRGTNITRQGQRRLTRQLGHSHTRSISPSTSGGDNASDTTPSTEIIPIVYEYPSAPLHPPHNSRQVSGSSGLNRRSLRDSSGNTLRYSFSSTRPRETGRQARSFHGYGYDNTTNKRPPFVPSHRGRSGDSTQGKSSPISKQDWPADDGLKRSPHRFKRDPTSVARMKKHRRYQRERVRQLLMGSEHHRHGDLHIHHHDHHYSHHHSHHLHHATTHVHHPHQHSHQFPHHPHHHIHLQQSPQSHEHKATVSCQLEQDLDVPNTYGQLKDHQYSDLHPDPWSDDNKMESASVTLATDVYHDGKNIAASAHADRDAASDVEEGTMFRYFPEEELWPPPSASPDSCLFHDENAMAETHQESNQDLSQAASHETGGTEERKSTVTGISDQRSVPYPLLRPSPPSQRSPSFVTAKGTRSSKREGHYQPLRSPIRALSPHLLASPIHPTRPDSGRHPLSTSILEASESTDNCGDEDECPAQSHPFHSIVPSLQPKESCPQPGQQHGVPSSTISHFSHDSRCIASRGSRGSSVPSSDTVMTLPPGIGNGRQVPPANVASPQPRHGCEWGGTSSEATSSSGTSFAPHSLIMGSDPIQTISTTVGDSTRGTWTEGGDPDRSSRHHLGSPLRSHNATWLPPTIEGTESEHHQPPQDPHLTNQPRAYIVTHRGEKVEGLPHEQLSLLNRPAFMVDPRPLVGGVTPLPIEPDTVVCEGKGDSPNDDSKLPCVHEEPVAAGPLVPATKPVSPILSSSHDSSHPADDNKGLAGENPTLERVSSAPTNTYASGTPKANLPPEKRPTTPGPDK